MRLQMRQELVKDCLFDRLALGRGLDHQVGLAQFGEGLRGDNPGKCGLHLVLRDFPSADLTFHVLANRRHGTL